MKFHHIGIFVKNLSNGKKELSKIVRIKKKSKIFIDRKLNVKVQFYYDHCQLCYELIAPHGKQNPVSAIIKSKKNILNHLAFKTKTFDKKVIELRNLGFAPLQEAKEAVAFNNKRVIFFLNNLNFIIELIED